MVVRQLCDSPMRGNGKATPSISPIARVATSHADRFAAFRLRYEVYVAEQGKGYPEADHERRLLCDELDADGNIVVAEVIGEIVGTVRANAFSSPLARARYAQVFELQHFANFKADKMVVCSRLAASPAHRQALARGLLFESIFEHQVRLGTLLAFATCAPPLARVFRGYGFREYAAPISDPVVGILHRTLLVLDDLEYLMRIGSPFAHIAARCGVAPTRRTWLDVIFTRYHAAPAFA